VPTYVKEKRVWIEAKDLEEANKLFGAKEQIDLKKTIKVGSILVVGQGLKNGVVAEVLSNRELLLQAPVAKAET
ncbi:unnamed protein product, partial [Amoebophrya sp. A25]